MGYDGGLLRWRNAAEYEQYFISDEALAYQWDVGSASTVKLVRERIAPDDRVLEIGPGLNRVSPISDTLDLSGNPTFKGRVEDVLELCKGRKYDKIVLIHVMEHISEDVRAMVQLQTLLSLGGEVIVIVPSGDGLTYDEVVNNGHVRRYDRARIYELEQYNGPCILLWYVHKFHNRYWNRLKFVLKALNFPFKVFDGKSMYSRWWYRALFPFLMRFMERHDRRQYHKPGGNIMAVYRRTWN